MDVLDQVFLLKQSQAPQTQTSEEARFEVHLGRGRQVWGDLAEPFEARLSELVGRAVWTRRPLWAVEPKKEIRDRLLAGVVDASGPEEQTLYGEEDKRLDQQGLWKWDCHRTVAQTLRGRVSDPFQPL